MKAVRAIARAAALPALLLCGMGLLRAASGAEAQPAPPDAAVKALALKWFAGMQAGAIDRSQLTSEYSAQLTEAAVQGMAKYMQAHAYGAAPLRAEIVEERAPGSQNFYVVKLVFPRGDAASLMIGIDGAGKITGLSLMTMAGD